MNDLIGQGEFESGGMTGVEAPVIHLPSPRRIAAEFDLRQSKRLGQCYLDNHRTLDQIVSVAGIEPSMAAIEVGPGPGYLTARILRRTPHVWAIEIDERMRAIHERYFGDVAPPVRFRYEDALRLDWNALLEEVGEQPYVVIGNIPYQITSPLLGVLLKLTPQPVRSVLLVQREFAERLAAQPGRKAYGALTVKMALVANVRQAVFVPRQRFQPRPRVDAAAIAIETRRPPLVEPERLPAVFALVEACFAQRRRKLVNSLLISRHLGDDRDRIVEILARADIDGSKRPETLKIEDFVRLAGVVE